jgi:hypothetical protein
MAGWRPNPFKYSKKTGIRSELFYRHGERSATERSRFAWSSGRLHERYATQLAAPPSAIGWAWRLFQSRRPWLPRILELASAAHDRPMTIHPLTLENIVGRFGRRRFLAAIRTAAAALFIA